MFQRFNEGEVVRIGFYSALLLVGFLGRLGRRLVGGELDGTPAD